MLALVWNHAGQNRLELMNPVANESIARIKLPGELVDSLVLSADGSLLAICITGPSAATCLAAGVARLRMAANNGSNEHL